MTQPAHIYMIAGEASGDMIGGDLLQALKSTQPDMDISGIGGAQMQLAGLNSLFEMHELSLMGFAEVLPHIRRLTRRIDETVNGIIAKQPNIVLSIDSPGFTFRVAKALRMSGQFSGKLVHYVAPTVWAYKPGRAQKTAALFDMLLCILPFEPPYFTVHGLTTHYVGHPSAWRSKTRGGGIAFRVQNDIAESALLLGVMPGSRNNELIRHLPLFRQTIGQLLASFAQLEVMIPTQVHLEHAIKEEVSEWPLPVHLVVGEANKKAAFDACDAALAKSGTVALETALANIPTVSAYRANPISVWLAQRMVRIPYANLVNILAYFNGQPPVIPEFLQRNATPANLCNALTPLLHKREACSQQQRGFASLHERLGAHDTLSPSEKAAQHILSLL